RLGDVGDHSREATPSDRGLGIEGAPQAPRRDAAIGREDLPFLAHLGSRGQRVPSAEQRDALADAEIVFRPHVDPRAVEHEEHLRRPPPDPADDRQVPDERLVVEAFPARREQAPVVDVEAEVADRGDLLARQAHAAQQLRIGRQDLRGARKGGGGVDRAKAAVDRLGGQSRELLPHDRAHEGLELRTSATQHREATDVFDEPRHGSVATQMRERAAWQANAYVPLAHDHCARMASIRASSSSEKARRASAATADSTCATRLAPTMTDVIAGWRSTHASAIWARLWPRSIASACNPFTLSNTAPVISSRWRKPCALAARESDGISRRYLSLRRPCASGE